MGGWEDAKRSRSWLETKLPAKGERMTAFFRMRPSWTGVMETVEAPMSMTKAVGLPEAKLGLFQRWPFGHGRWGDERSEDTVPGEPEGGTAPVFHCYFYAFFSIFASVPAGFGHE